MTPCYCKSGALPCAAIPRSLSLSRSPSLYSPGGYMDVEQAYLLGHPVFSCRHLICVTDKSYSSKKRTFQEQVMSFTAPRPRRRLQGPSSRALQRVLGILAIHLFLHAVEISTMPLVPAPAYTTVTIKGPSKLSQRHKNESRLAPRTTVSIEFSAAFSHTCIPHPPTH